MKLKKLKLNELSNTDLNERGMVRILGGGEPGCCQCGCNYEGEPGGSSNENFNRVHFSISSEDRKIVLPILLNDSVLANLFFDTGGTFLLIIILNC